MKVFVLAPQEDWICDRLVAEWYHNFSDITTTNILKADVIWLLAGWCWNHIHPDLLRSKKLVVTEHHIVPEKFTSHKLKNFMIRDQFVNVYHAPNEKTARFLRKLTKKPIRVISYWLNSDMWQAFSKETARKDLKISQSDFCIGSFQRDTEGHDLKTPKLEKGPDLFCDFVEKAASDKENLHVILGGWRRQYVINRLKSKNIKYSLFEKAPIDLVKKMYAACDLYVVSSRYEGGPQAIIEASAMKIPIISTDVGIASSILSGRCITDLSEFFIPASEIDYNYENVKKIDIKKIGKEYISMFEGLLNE